MSALDKMTFREPNAALLLERELDKRDTRGIADRMQTHPHRGTAIRVFEQVAQRAEGGALQAVVEVMALAFRDAPGTQEAYKQALLHEADSNRWLSLWWFIPDVMLRRTELVLAIALEMVRQQRDHGEVSLPLRQRTRNARSQPPLSAPRLWLKRLVRGEREVTVVRHPAAELLAQVRNTLDNLPPLQPEQARAIGEFNAAFGWRIRVEVARSKPAIPKPASGPTPLPSMDGLLFKKDVLRLCRRRDGLARFAELLKRPEQLRRVEPFSRELYFDLSWESFGELWNALGEQTMAQFGTNLISLGGSKLPLDWLLETLEQTVELGVAEEILRQLRTRHPTLGPQPHIAASLVARFPSLQSEVRSVLWRSIPPVQNEFPLWQAVLPLRPDEKATALILGGREEVMFCTPSALSVRSLRSGQELASARGSDLPLAITGVRGRTVLGYRRQVGQAYQGGPLFLLSLAGAAPTVRRLEGTQAWTAGGDEVHIQDDTIWIVQPCDAHDFHEVYIHQVDLDTGETRPSDQYRGRVVDPQALVAILGCRPYDARLLGDGCWLLFDGDRRRPLALRRQAVPERPQVSVSSVDGVTLTLDEFEPGTVQLACWLE